MHTCQAINAWDHPMTHHATNAWASLHSACDDSATNNQDDDITTGLALLARPITHSPAVDPGNHARKLHHPVPIRGAMVHDREMEIAVRSISSIGTWSLGWHQPRFHTGADHQDHLQQVESSEVDHAIMQNLQTCQTQVDQTSSTADHAHKVTHDKQATSPRY